MSSAAIALNLHWFSPLPPEPSDIGHYTRRLLPALTQRARLTLWTRLEHPGLEPSGTQLAETVSIKPWRDDWRALNEADLVVYHLGNNAAMHHWIWEVSQRHPGVVVVHDLCLQHFFLGYYLEHCHRPEVYRQVMGRHYGAAGFEAVDDYFDGRCSALDLAAAYPLIEHAVEGSLGVLLHTPSAFERVTSLNRYPVLYHPLPYPIGPNRHAPSAPAPGEPFRLIAFGYMGTNRRLDALIEALASFSHRTQLRLDIYGELYDPTAIRQLIVQRGLSQQVALHGFVAERELEVALKRSHLAINLRFPSMGEASGSQLRIFDHARPSLVTRTGWYADLPPEAVAFVEPAPEREIDDLHRHWRRLIQDPGRFAAMGAAGRAYLEREHRPQSYVEALTMLLPHTAASRSAEVREQLFRRAVGQLQEWSVSGDALDLERLAQALMGLGGAREDLLN